MASQNRSTSRRNQSNEQERAASDPSEVGVERVAEQPEIGLQPDRRTATDRRADHASDQVDGEQFETGLERRRGVGRRRSDWARAAEEGEMTREQFLFIKAIEAFKRSNDVMYPTWTDVLEVVRLLGYRKTLNSELNIPSAEDWTERPNALSGVRAKPGHPEQSREAA